MLFHKFERVRKWKSTEINWSSPFFYQYSIFKAISILHLYASKLSCPEPVFYHRPCNYRGVLGTSDSGKSCRAYSSLNKQGCQTCPDTRNNFDACRWRTRVVSEVEYWWKRAYDQCKLTWNSFKTHQNNILHSLTSKKEAVASPM